MSDTIEVTRMIPARPERIFAAWLSGEEHGLMIGSTATYNDATGEFTAWDGYISGRTTAKEPNRRIVQAWRTTEFPEGAPDSKLEVRLSEQDGSTRVTLVHTDIPDGQGESYEIGWSDHYFDPMTDYFSSARSRLKDAGEAITDAAEQVQGAFSEAADEAGERLEAVGKEVKKAAKKVQKSARAAQKKVEKLVATAKRKLAAAGKKGGAKKGKARKPAPKKRPAPKKKASRGKAKKRR